MAWRKGDEEGGRTTTERSHGDSSVPCRLFVTKPHFSFGSEDAIVVLRLR